jgi:hypothetical protein
MQAFSQLIDFKAKDTGPPAYAGVMFIGFFALMWEFYPLWGCVFSPLPGVGSNPGPEGVDLQRIYCRK